MATSTRLIETWKESPEYEKAQALIEKVMAIDDDTVTHVAINVITRDPESLTGEKRESVIWNRRYETVEES